MSDFNLIEKNKGEQTMPVQFANLSEAGKLKLLGNACAYNLERVEDFEKHFEEDSARLRIQTSQLEVLLNQLRIQTIYLELQAGQLKEVEKQQETQGKQLEEVKKQQETQGKQLEEVKKQQETQEEKLESILTLLQAQQQPGNPLE